MIGKPMMKFRASGYYWSKGQFQDKDSPCRFLVTALNQTPICSALFRKANQSGYRVSTRGDDVTFKLSEEPQNEQLHPSLSTS